MRYELDLHEPLGATVIGVVTSQVDQALEGLATIEGGTSPERSTEVVHDARKRAKKVRAVARAVRDAVGDEGYHAVNDAARDGARELSDVRDAQVLGETVDELLGWAKEHESIDVDRRRHQVARVEVQRRAEQATARPDLATAAGRAGDLLRLARASAEGWTVPDDLDALADGLDRTYRRGRAGWKAARRARTVEALHEWRKRVKYGWYHLRLLGPVAPEVLGDEARRFHQLADVLGDDHDLAVLACTVSADPEAWGGTQRAGELADLAGVRRRELQAAAFLLGSQLFVRKPAARLDHLERLWAS